MATKTAKLEDALVARIKATVAQAERFVGTVNGNLRALERKLAERLARLPDNSNVWLQRREINRLLEELRGEVRQAFIEIGTASENRIADIVKLQSSRTVQSVNTIMGVELRGLPSQLIEQNVSRLLVEGVPMREWWAAQGDKLLNRFGGLVQKKLREGTTIGDIARELSSDKTLSLLAREKFQAEALVRTGTIATLNETNLEMFMQNSDIIQGIQWVAKLDSRTTPICEYLNGKTWTLDFKPIGHHAPFPGAIAHWNCRSTQIPVLRPLDELAGI